MKAFWKWYLNSGRIDGHVRPWRRAAVGTVPVLLTALWLWVLLKWMPSAKTFVARVYSNPFVILAFVGIYLYTKSMEYLQYRISTTGQQPPSRGAWAQNDKRLFETYKLAFGEDAAFKLPRRLQLVYMAFWAIAIVSIFLQGPFKG